MENVCVYVYTCCMFRCDWDRGQKFLASILEQVNKPLETYLQGVYVCVCVRERERVCV